MGKAADLWNSVIGNIPKAVITFHDNVEAEGGMGAQTVSRSIEVQYNPSSISFSTVADDAELQSIQNDFSGILFQSTCPTNTVMSFDLIFDDVNNLDAFMNEKFVISTGMAAAAAAKIKNKTYSVRHQINAFVGMISSSRTRCITFSWSQFNFCGELVSLSSELTMFNVAGNPVRGKVSLRIQQKEDGNRVNENEHNNAFDKLFGGNLYTSASVDSKSLGDKFGNLLNLNLL